MGNIHEKIDGAIQHLINTPPSLEQASSSAKEENTTLLDQAVKERGESFCRAARLIIDNKLLITSRLSQDEKILQNALRQLSKIEQGWAGKTTYQKEDIFALQHELMRVSFAEQLVGLEPYSQPYLKKVELIKAKEALDNAENHINWKPRDPVITPVSHGEYTYIQMEFPVSKFTEEQTKEYLQILTDTPSDRPAWFNHLQAWEQNWFREKVLAWQAKKKEQDTQGITAVNLGEFLGPVPTTIRRYPGAPNFYQHALVILDKNGTEVHRSIRTRTGIDYPAKMKPKSERFRITKQNIKQIIELELDRLIEEDIRRRIALGETDITSVDIPHLIQTLVSPGITPGDMTMVDAKQAAIDELREKYADPRSKTVMVGHQSYTVSVNVDISSSNRAMNRVRGFSDIHPYSRSNLENNRTIVQLGRRKADRIDKILTALDSRAGKVNLNQGGFNTLDEARAILNTLKDDFANNPFLLKTKESDIHRLVHANILTERQAMGFKAQLKLQSHSRPFRVNAFGITLFPGIPPSSLGQNDTLPHAFNNSFAQGFGMLAKRTLGIILNTIAFLPRLIKAAAIAAVPGKFSNAQLAIASAENISMETENGGVNGKCMSGKDRKAMETMHTDATIIQSLKSMHSDQVPETPTDEAALLFLSSHHERVSAENAKGSIGIKNISDVFGDSSHNIGAAISQLSEQNLAQKRQNEIQQLQSELSSLQGSEKPDTKRIEAVKSLLKLAQNPIKYSEKKASLNKISQDKLSGHLAKGHHPLAEFTSPQTSKDKHPSSQKRIKQTAEEEQAAELAKAAQLALSKRSNTYSVSKGHQYTPIPTSDTEVTPPSLSKSQRPD